MTDKEKKEFKSKYFDETNLVIDKLNEVSPSFCLAKWFNVSIHIPIGQTHSCYHPKHHAIPLEEIKIDVSALHNTKFKKEQRAKMLKGERPSECNFCWEIEDSGSQLSDRAYRSRDVYSDTIIEEAIRLGSEGNAKPRYVEVNFNQACNFKCSYCSPHISTAWMADIEKHGAFNLSDRPHHDLGWMRDLNVWPNNSPDNPYLLAFWEWFPTVYPTLNTFRMTGGEPLMDKSTFRVFDYVKRNPKPDLHLSITSNCCPPGRQWSKFMSSLKDITKEGTIDHFLLYCSLDSWGPQAEYIRNGMNFDTLYHNVCEYLEKGNKHSLTFIITFNSLSYFGFTEYVKNILALRKKYNTERNLIWFDIPQLEFPEYLNPKINPEFIFHLEEAKEFMLENQRTTLGVFDGFYDFEVSKVQRLIDWIKGSGNFDIIKAKKNFYLFFKDYDRRNNTKFLEHFPEMKDFWKSCRDLKPVAYNARKVL
jgi:hypothetical protein